MKVQVESRRMIKPANMYDDSATFSSSPNLLPLSSADLGEPSSHIKILYAFKAPTPPTTVLEEGLAEALREFREWAGRFTEDKNGRPAIELNDEGVVWVEAVADGTLEDAMPFNPSPLYPKFFPPYNGVPELLLVQVTRLACGGLVLGIARHHHVADGAAASVFMNGWSQIVRGQPIHPFPVHDRSLLLTRDPPRPAFDHIEYGILTQPCDRSSEIITKRIHFSGEILKQIRATASQNAEKPYTRFESLLAHLWRCVSIARGLRGEVVTKARCAVNGRNRLTPPLPPEYFGNAAFGACTETTVNELVRRPLQFAANLIQNAIARIDDEYIRSAMDFLEVRVRDGVKPMQINGVRQVASPNLLASSWIHFPLYDLDFGWGGPSYAGVLASPREGLSVFMPSYTKDGSIDVVMVLFEEVMAKLEEICYRL